MALFPPAKKRAFHKAVLGEILDERVISSRNRRDRVVQGSLKLILEAIFEADFCPNSYGFRPRRSPHRALAEVSRSVLRRMSTVIEVDLSRLFRLDSTLGAVR